METLRLEFPGSGQLLHLEGLELVPQDAAQRGGQEPLSADFRVKPMGWMIVWRRAAGRKMITRYRHLSSTRQRDSIRT